MKLRFSSALATLLLFFLGVVAHASTISLRSSSVTVSRSDSYAYIPVDLVRTDSLTLSGTVFVNYTTVDGSGTNGGIYTQTSGTMGFITGSGTLANVLTFSGTGPQISGTIAVPLLAYSGSTPFPQFFSVILTSPSPGVGLTRYQTDVRVLDNQGPQTIEFSQQDYIGKSNANAMLAVYRSGDNTNPVTFNFSTVTSVGSGYAQPGQDYVRKTSVPVTIPAGSYTTNVPVRILSNANRTTDLVFYALLSSTDPSVTISGTGAGTVGTGVGEATIHIPVTSTTNASAFALSSPTYQYSATTSTISSAVVTVTRSGNLYQTDYVNYQTLDLTAVGNYDYTPAYGTLVFDPGVSSIDVPVTLLPRANHIGNLFFNFVLSSPVANTAGTTTSLDLDYASATVTISDPSAISTFSFLAPNQNVQRSGVLGVSSTVYVPVMLNRDPSLNVSNSTLTVLVKTGTIASNSVNPYQAKAGITQTSDFVAISGSLVTFAPGVSVVNVPVVINSGTDFVNDYAFTFIGTAVTPGVVFGDANGATTSGTEQITIKGLKNTGVGQLTFATGDVLANDGQGYIDIPVYLVRQNPSTKKVTVNYQTVIGDAGTDRFTPVQGTLTFGPNIDIQTIRVPLLNNGAVYPLPQKFYVVLSNPQNSVLGTYPTATVTLNNVNGSNQVQFESANYAFPATDGATHGTATTTGTNWGSTASLYVRVKRNGDPTQKLVVNWVTTDITAVSGVNFGANFSATNHTPVSGTLVIAPGNNYGEINIPLLFGSDTAGSWTGVKTFKVSLQKNTTDPNGAYTSIGAQSESVVTIYNDSQTNWVEFGVPSMTAAENGPAIAIPVIRHGFFANPFNISDDADVVWEANSVKENGDTAIANVDYIPASNQKLKFVHHVAGGATVGEDTVQYIYIPLIWNHSITGNRTFTVTLDSATGAVIPQPGYGNNTMTVVISDADQGMRVTFEQPEYSVANDAGSVTLNVKLDPSSGDPSHAVSVYYAAEGLTASDGFDFTPVAGVLTFPAYTYDRTITVPVFETGLVKQNVSFRVSLSDPSPGLILGDTKYADVTIINTDYPDVPSVNVAADPAVTQYGTTPGAFTISRTGSTSTPLTVSYSIVGTAQSGADYVAIPSSVTIPAGQVSVNVPVTALQNFQAQENRTVTILVNNSSTSLAGEFSQASVTILNPQATGLGVTIQESGSAINLTGQLAYTITVYNRSPLAAENVTIQQTIPLAMNVSATDIPVITGSDGGLLTGTIGLLPANWSQTFHVIMTPTSAPLFVRSTVTVASNSVDNNPTDNTATSGITQIVAAEPNTVNVTATVATTQYGSTPGVFTFTRTGGSTLAPLTVPFQILGSAEAGTDFTAIDSFVTIPSGTNSATVGITALPNFFATSSKTVTLQISNSTTFITGTSDNATVTIAQPLPLVTIDADPLHYISHVNTGVAGNFVLTRTGSTLLPLKVTVQFGSTARNGIDYTTNPKTAAYQTVSFVIPASQSSLKVKIVPVKKTLKNGDLFVSAKVIPRASVYFASQPVALPTITITQY